MKQIERRIHGFTIIEVIVVIAIIGILASISVVGYSTWKVRAAETSIKNDLNSVKAAMETSRNRDNGYPAVLPDTVKASSGVTLTYVSGDANSYCVEGVSTTDSAIKFNVKSATGEIQSGMCLSDAPQFVQANVVVNSDRFNADWADYTGAISYEIEWRINGGGWTGATALPSTYQKTGATSGQVYDIRISANLNDGSQSAWSEIVTVTIPEPAITLAGVCSMGGSQQPDTLYWNSQASTVYPGFQIFNPEGDDVEVNNTLTGPGQFLYDIGGPAMLGSYEVYAMRTDGTPAVPSVWIDTTGPAQDCS